MFGRVISDQRKKLGLSQKELAALIKKDDGSQISPQYLNDIEHDRRNPPPDLILHQLADSLKLSRDYLHFIAGELPDNLPKREYKPEQVEAALKVFRRELRK